MTSKTASVFEPPDTAEHTEAARFIDTIYQGQRGYRELCYIIGDPDDRENSTFHQEWYVLAQHDQMLARIDELQALGCNVYVGASTYRKRQRAKKNALPSRAIVIDDAPAGEYTFTVQTGPNSQHAWILTPHWLEPHDRERIARNAAYATGGDKGGWDCTQLVRVPGGLNTKAKYGGAFRVHLIAGTGKTYHLNELEARWPAVPQQCSDSAVAWDSIAPYASNMDGVLARVGTHTITHQQLHSDGGPDRNRRRWGLACELRKRYGFPAHCIAAILFQFNWGHLDEKGSDWLRADIERCIADANARYPNVTTTEPYCITGNPIQPLPQVERKSRARKDRPQRVTPDSYLAWLHDHMVGAGGTVMMTRKEIAAALSISVPTVDRLERALREQGKIEHRTNKARTHRYLVILGAINISDAPQKAVENQPAEVLSATRPENAEIAHQDAVNVNNENAPVEETHRPEGSSPTCVVPGSFRLADAMRAAIEAAACEHGRVSKKRVQDQFAQFFAGIRWSDRTYERVLKRRTQEHQLARIIAWAQGAKTQPAELKRKARSLAYQQRRAIEAGHEAKAYALGRQANVIEDEIEARILRGEIRRKGPKRSQMPCQPPLFQVTDPARQEPSRPCVSPLPHVVVLPRIEVRPHVDTPPARSEKDELHASVVRDLASWGKYVRAFDQAELIADETYCAAHVAYIRAAQLAGGRA